MAVWAAAVVVGAAAESPFFRVGDHSLHHHQMGDACRSYGHGPYPFDGVVPGHQIHPVGREVVYQPCRRTCGHVHVSDACGQKFYCRDYPLAAVVVAAAETLQREGVEPRCPQ
jgi:hypothetical protein